LSCTEPHRGDFEFAPEEIEWAVRNHKLLSLEIEISQACNFRCIYCYNSSGVGARDHLDLDEAFDAIRQAKDLGARLVVILGGEPMILPSIMNVVEFIHEQGLRTQVFTNGTDISPERARRLRELNVGVVVKMESLDREVYESLTGIEGSYDIMRYALGNLRGAGYPASDALLGCSAVITRKNLKELPDMWRWLRDRNISPYFEMLTPQGAAAEHAWLNPTIEENRDVFYAIAEIDRTEYGIEWDPQPPLVGNRCMRHRFSCMVNSSGDVVPCVGVPTPVGSIRKSSLKEILETSTLIDDLRHYQEKIKGPCRDCEKLDRCYGCRGSAYNLTGDCLASDPSCWLNPDHTRVAKPLPAKVDGILPHGEPALLIDRIHACGDDWGEVSVRLAEDALLASGDGALEDVAYLEMIAQAVAACSGFRDNGGESRPREGYLLGAKSLRILGEAHPREELRVRVKQVAHLGDFGVVEGQVLLRDEVIATGEVKIWQKPIEPEEAAPPQSSTRSS